MAPTKKTSAKVKDLSRKAVSARKAGSVKGGQKQQPYPKTGSTGA